jgi:hypothetical protein
MIMDEADQELERQSIPTFLDTRVMKPVNTQATADNSPILNMSAITNRFRGLESDGCASIATGRVNDTA